MSSLSWPCHSIDISAAFLQGDGIDREVYVLPAPEFNNGKIWKLRKTVYGLNDAARAWYIRVKCELLKLGMEVSSLDPALFYWQFEERLAGIICLHVDDFFWSGTQKFENIVIAHICKVFSVGKFENGALKYVGLNIENKEGSFLVHQIGYASSLSTIVMSHKRMQNKNASLNEEEKRKFRSVIGQLSWMSTQTRPDVAFEVGELSQLYGKACVGDMIRANKAVQRVKTDHVKLMYPQLKNMRECCLECYADASFGNLMDGGSQGGYVIFLSDGFGNRCPLSWQSRKLRRVVKSTLAAETLALLDCAEAAVFLSSVIFELSKYRVPIKCYVDNKSLVESLYSSKLVDDRRLRIDMAVLKDMIGKKEIASVLWIPTVHQLANALTKRGASVAGLLSAVSGQLRVE